jgi:hypothetical protein
MPTPEHLDDLNRETSAHALIGFVTITHPSLPGGALRYVTDVVGYVWGGQEYTPIGGIDLPQADDVDNEPRIRVTVPNIEREVGQVLRTAGSRLKVSLSLLSTADFDLTVTPRAEIDTGPSIYTLSEFEVVEADFDDMMADLSLILRDYATEPYGIYATPSLLPGIYA